VFHKLSLNKPCCPGKRRNKEKKKKILTSGPSGFHPRELPRAARSQLASPLSIPLLSSLSLYRTPSGRSASSRRTWSQRTFRNKDNARTAPRNEEGNCRTQRATEHTRHANANGWCARVVRLETLRGIGGAVHGERLVRVEGVAALPGDDVAALPRPSPYTFLSLSLFRARATPVGRWWRQPPPRGLQERRRARGHPQNAAAPVLRETR